MSKRKYRKAMPGRISKSASSSMNRHQQRRCIDRSMRVWDDVNASGDTHHCCDKVSYRSLKDARAAARKSMRSTDAEALAVYRCRHCGGYHLTSQLPRAGQPAFLEIPLCILFRSGGRMSGDSYCRERLGGAVDAYAG